MITRVQNYLPVRGYFFNRPLVIFQSDDWGLCGIRDSQTFDALCAAGFNLGQNPYDFHSLETADDLRALYKVLAQHHDVVGRAPTFVFNFIVANVDCERALANGLNDDALVPLDAGLPNGWQRPKLWDAYREGIAQGFVHPAFHGITHFCSPVAARTLVAQNERGELLRTLYHHRVALLYSQASWLSFEYKDDADAADGAWLDQAAQTELIARGAAHFSRMFGVAPRSACAPGYRANIVTRRVYVQQNIRVAQNGPGLNLAPHFDLSGILMLYRNVSLEPALDPTRYTVDAALAHAQRAVADGKPIIVCTHAVNFHSTLKNYRDETLARLDEFLSRLQDQYPDLLYLDDSNMYDIVTRGAYDWRGQHISASTNQQWQRSLVMAAQLSKG